MHEPQLIPSAELFPGTTRQRPLRFPPILSQPQMFPHRLEASTNDPPPATTHTVHRLQTVPEFPIHPITAADIMKSHSTPPPTLNRRQFLQESGLVALAGTLASNTFAAAPNTASPPLLRIGLIGCGGRGTGAAAQALAADPHTQLVAMSDGFADRIQSSLATLRKQPGLANRIDVPDSRCYPGFDGYHQVIEQSDVVLLATPPHFRPMHIEAAVDAGKHVFAEKPVAVDAPGVRKVLAACQRARDRGLSVVCGLQMRHSPGHRELVQRVQADALGPIRTLQANDYRGPIWVNARQADWTDMEYQMRNWYYFTWLSGDFNVEQHIHMLDLCAWIMRDQYPVRAYGTGGRQVRTGPDHGNIYDHHAVTYEYENGVKLFAACRQMPGCMNDISVEVMGAKGLASIRQRALRIDTDHPWIYRGESTDAQQVQHNEWFASIRHGQPLNQGDYMTRSTLMAIMGRMATYTGQAISWDQAMQSQEDLSPDRYHWSATPPPSQIAIPGVTRLL
jgi:predicted dehydrogenase